MSGLVRSVGRSLTRRWVRHVLTLAAMAVGAGTLVSVISVNETSAQRLAATVASLQSDTVRVTMPRQTWNESEAALVRRATDSLIVDRVGTFVDARSGSRPVDVRTTTSAGTARVETVVATTAGLRARGARLLAGSLPNDDAGSGGGGSGAVVIGRAIAGELSLSTEPGANTLTVDGAAMWVRGVVRDAPGESTLNSAIVLLPDVAEHLGVLPEQRSMVLVARTGAVRELASIAPIVLFPDAPDEVDVVTAPSPERLRAELLAGSRSLVLTVAGVSALAATLGVVTTMLIAVRERRREIGIARAMGESRAAIWRRFLLECIVLGLVGGTAGWMLGVLAGAAVVQAQGSVFSMPPWTFSIIPASGVLGAAAGSLPAWAASRVSPATLLRAE